MVMTPHDRRNLFFYFRHIDERYADAPAFEANWKAIADAGFDHRDLAEALYSMAVHSAEFPFNTRRDITRIISENASVWTQEVEKRISTFNQQDFAGSLWACAVLDCLDRRGTTSRGLRDIAAFLYKQMPANELRIKDQQQVHDAALWFDFPEEFTTPDENNIPSELGNRLRVSFERYAGRPAGRYIPAMDHTTDIAWRTQKDKKILLEVDGDRHFMRDSISHLQLNVGTLFQTALVTKSEPTAVLLRMPYMEGYFLLDQPEEIVAEYIGRLSQQAQGLGVGQAFLVAARRIGTDDLTPTFTPIFDHQRPSVIELASYSEKPLQVSSIPLGSAKPPAAKAG